MNKKMRELYAKMEEKTKAAKALLADGETKDVEKANQLLKEVEALQAEYDAEKKLVEAEKGLAEPLITSKEKEADKKAGEKGKEDVIAEFAKNVRALAKGVGINATVDEEGGYVVPEDVQTKINTYKDANFSMLDLVDVEPVTTATGSRTYQTKAEVEGFVETDEDGEITEIDAPKFEAMKYAIKNYTGFMPVTNQVLNDSDQNLVEVISQWFGKNSLATANRLILAKLQSKEEVAFDGIKGIKSCLNKTLGQAYKASSIIVTNDDGLDYLDQLEDKNGRPLLNADPTAPAKMQLRCGATVVQVVTIPNKVLKTVDNKAPFIVGDIFEAVKYFDRQKMSLLASSVAAIGQLNAFAKNLTLFRGIEREDVQIKDKDAWVNGYIDITPVEATNEGE